MLASLFFVSAHKDSATRHGCALRSACRGASACQWRSAANRSQLPLRSVLGAPHWGAAPEAAGETSLSALLLAFPIRSPLFSTVPIPSSTQNAPGFAFFWLNRVRFALFDLF